MKRGDTPPQLKLTAIFKQLVEGLHVVTFLFAVIEDSGKRWRQESVGMRQAMVRYDEIVGVCAAQHQGFIVESRDENDSCLVVFDQATDAVIAAGALQRACAAEPWPTSTPIQICVAMHTGEADLQNSHYDGLAAKLCAHLAMLGHSGQTLLSRATYEMTHTMVAPDVTLRDLQECYFVLVTSRVALRLSNEQVFLVDPLALPDLNIYPPQGATLVTPPPIGSAQLSTLENCPSVGLFVQRAQAVKPDFKLTGTNGRVVAEICLRLDGLPLAIELAAARIRLLPPGELLKRLDKRLSLLIGGPRDLPNRQQTLRAAIEWSYKLLAPMEQTLLACLAVFVGGCTLEDAELICGHSAEIEIDMLNGLMSLVDSSLLLQREAASDEVRYAMLETIRDYAAEQLSAHPAAEAIRRQHALCYLAMAEEAEPQLRGAKQDTWLDRLEHEHGNLRAALSWSIEGGAAEIAARLSGALWRFWEVRGYLTEGRAWLERALAACDKAIGDDPTILDF